MSKATRLSPGYKTVPGAQIVLSFAVFKLVETPPAASTDANTEPQKQAIDLTMKTTAIFYHAGCPVCIEAEQNVAAALDPARFNIEIVHLGEQQARVAEAERAGIKSVPALVLDGLPFHINFGAGIEALK